MAILREHTVDFVSRSPEQTERLGVRLGELLMPGDIICLSGEMGSGKTTLARGIGRGWGTPVRVTSPTFTLINAYPRAGDNHPFYHVDAYRLTGTEEKASVADIESTGFFDLLDNEPVVMIEWADRITDYLPADRLWIVLRYVDATCRGLRIEAFGDRPVQLLQAFRRSAFGI